MMDADIKAKFDEQEGKIDQLTAAITALTTEVKKGRDLSSGSGLNSQSSVSDNRTAVPIQGGASGGSSASNEASYECTSYDIVQHEFKKLSDTYVKTHLPPEIKLHVERTGFRGEESRKLNIVASCAKYSELILKIVSDIPEVESEKIQEIALCAQAQQLYLQSEYANLVVHSNFDSQTAKLFRQLQRNTSAFPPAALDTLRSAASISAAQNQHQQAGQGQRRYGSGGGGSQSRHWRNKNQYQQQNQYQQRQGRDRDRDPYSVSSGGAFPTRQDDNT